MGGVAFTLLLLVVGYQSGQFGGSNDYTGTFDLIGDMVRNGQNPYSIGLVYSPPVALWFAAFSWLPVQIAEGVVLLTEVAALRYIAGSWLGVGMICWCPLLAFEFALGNLNLVVGAGIAGAALGRGWAGVVGGLVKLSPFIAIREWRTAAIAGAIALVITLPWLGWWVDWVHNLLVALPVGNVGGPIVPIPLPVRVVAVVGLLALRRPWAVALAAVIAVPAFHYQTLLLLVVPVAVWFRTPARRGGAPE